MLYGFDTETYVMVPGTRAPPLVCASVADPAQVLLRVDTLTWLRKNLSHQEVVGAMISYDAIVTANADPKLLDLWFKAYAEGRVHDVQIREKLLDIERGCLVDKKHPWRSKLKKVYTGYSLEMLCDRYLGLDLADDKRDKNSWRLRFGELDDVPLSEWPQEAIDYVLDDAAHPLEIFRAQEGVARTFGLGNLADEPAQVRAAFGLALTASWGMRTDPKVVAEVTKQVEAEHEATQKRFREVGIYRADGSKDTKVLKARVAAAYGDKAPRAAKGGIKTDRDTMANSGDPVLEEFADAGENETLYTGYLKNIQLGTRVPICPNVDPLKANGRASYFDPDRQKMPRGGRIRETHVPREGYYLCSCDYTTLELCTLAQCCLWMFGQSSLADVLRQDRDCHIYTASKVVGATYEEVLKLKEAGDPRIKAIRQACKPVNFGLPGGEGARKLAWTARRAPESPSLKSHGVTGVRFCLLFDPSQECGRRISRDTYINPHTHQPRGMDVCAACLERAEELREAWRRSYPEMIEYFARATAATREGHGKVKQFVSGRVRSGLNYTEWCNTWFSGLAADGSKHALWNTQVECYTRTDSPLFGTRPVLHVHDEILAEVPIVRAHEAAVRLSQVMQDSMRLYCPDIPIKAPPALMRRWYKGAEPVYVDGRLVPWEPHS